MLKLVEFEQLDEKLQGDTNIRAERQKATQFYEKLINKRLKCLFSTFRLQEGRVPFS